MSDLPYSLPLKVSTVDGTPSVLLGEMELAGVLSAEGLSIRYETFGARSVPIVEMTFGPGNLTVEFLEDLAEHAHPGLGDQA